MTVRVEKNGEVTLVVMDRPQARNAVNPEMAEALFRAFIDFGRDETAAVAVLAGAPGVFSIGLDLEWVAGGIDETWFADHELDGSFDGRDDQPRKAPMGPTRLTPGKPVIAAVTGPAVAGGMELALWCDLRVMERTASMGVYGRRRGVPLIDGGTVRLPRLVGHGRAMELILTGRKIEAGECAAIGLASYLCDEGKAVETALALARDLARQPQTSLRADRLSAIRQWSLGPEAALAEEWQSADVLRFEGVAGVAGENGGGDFEDI